MCSQTSTTVSNQTFITMFIQTLNTMTPKVPGFGAGRARQGGLLRSSLRPRRPGKIAQTTFQKGCQVFCCNALAEFCPNKSRLI